MLLLSPNPTAFNGLAKGLVRIINIVEVMKQRMEARTKRAENLHGSLEQALYLCNKFFHNIWLTPKTKA